MFRQSAPLAQRLVCGNVLQSNTTGSSKLMWNAAMFSSKTGTQAVASEMQVSGVAPQAVAQFSVNEAALLASKRKNIIGSGISLKATQSFAASAAAPIAAREMSTAAPAAEKSSILKKVLKAAAAVVAAVGLTATTAAADAPIDWQFVTQDTATSYAQAAMDLHHDIFFFNFTILALVFYMMFQIATKFHYTKQVLPEKFTHNTTLEVLWTVIPTLIVVLIAIPSLTLVYSLDQHTDKPGLTVKVIGRQWYWSYEMHDHLQHKLMDPERLVAIAERTLEK